MKDTVLENFMKEHFPFRELVKQGFFTKDMKGDYEAQAERICKWFGYKTVYEYGSQEISVHLSYANPPMHINEKGELGTVPFITVIPSIWDK